MKKYMQTSLIILLLGMLMVSKIQAFDCENDPNWEIFNRGSSRTYTSPIKAKEIRWEYSVGENPTKTTMKVVRKGISLVEIKTLANDSAIDLKFQKYSDGSSAIICTGKHDVTGHTLVMMIEPNNRYAYVYDTDSCVSEVIDLGEAVHIYQGRTLVPLRKFIEAFGAKVTVLNDKGRYSIIWPSLHK